MLLEIGGEITPERMKRQRQRKKKYPGVDVTGDGSKVRCHKEPYCIGTWNIRSTNQVKQEMAKVNIDILAINKLKWTRTGEFTQVTIISTTAGKNPLAEVEME